MADRDDIRRDDDHATTGGASVAGAITGGLVGSVAGPLGTAIGAAGGAAAGAMMERAMHGDDGHEHLEGDEVHTREDHVCTGMDDGHDHTHHYVPPTRV